MNFYLAGFNHALLEKSAAPMGTWWQRFLAPTRSALATRVGVGAAAGGGLGYLTGTEQYDWLGRPVGSDRWQRALTGAIIGGTALGAAPRAAEAIGRATARQIPRAQRSPFQQWASRRHAYRTGARNIQQARQQALMQLTPEQLQQQQLVQQTLAPFDERLRRLQQFYYRRPRTPRTAAPTAPAAPAPTAPAPTQRVVSTTPRGYW